MSTIEPSSTHILKIWWFVVWRSALLGALAGGIVGFLLGFVMASTSLPAQTQNYVFQIGGYLAGLAVFSWVLSMLLQKSFSDFRIVLVSLDETTKGDT